MNKKNKLSYTSMTTYNECGYKYKLNYIDKIKPKKVRSALLFGKAIDEGLNELLLTRDISKAKTKFNFWWTRNLINNEWVELKKTDLIIYSKMDLDLDLGDTEWESLKRKGIIILEEYNKKALPRINKLLEIQKKVIIGNSDGDKIEGYIDLIANLDEGNYILDNKTTSVKYKSNSASESDQLNLYYFLEKDSYKLDGVGFIVMNKNIRKEHIKNCSKCKKEFNNNRLMKCKECKIDLKHVETKFSCDIDFILNKPDLSLVNSVIEKFDKTNNDILDEKFDKNYKSCVGKFGKCQYYDLCHKNNTDDFIIPNENKNESNK